MLKASNAKRAATVMTAITAVGQPAADADDAREAKRQRMQVTLEAGEVSHSSSSPDAKMECALDTAAQTLSLNASSDSSHSFTNYEVRLKPLLARVGMKIVLAGTAAQSAACIKIARELSLSGDAAAPTPTSAHAALALESSEASASVAGALRRELARAGKYSLPIAYAAVHPQSKERAEYRLRFASTAASARADVAVTCVETSRTCRIVVHADAIVARILCVSGIGADECINDVFQPSSVRDDEHASDSEPWKLRLAATGVVTLLVRLPDDEFTDGVDIFAPVATFHMLSP